VTTADDKPVPGGTIIVTTWQKRRKGERSSRVKVQPGKGTFRAKLPATWAIGELYYTGAPGYADCKSEVRPPKKV
jgi:hypothetical protein